MTELRKVGSHLALKSHDYFQEVGHMKKLFVLLLVLTMSGVFAFPSDPDVITDINTCVQSAPSNNVPYGSIYLVHCNFYNAAGDGVEAQIVHFGFYDNTDSAPGWHNPEVKPECLDSYQGGVLADGCYYLTGTGGAGMYQVVINDQHHFVIGHEYNVRVHADDVQNTTLKFNVTTPTFTTDYAPSSVPYGSEWHGEYHIDSSVIPYTCDVGLYDGDVQQWRLGSYTTTGRDTLTLRFNTFGLQLFKNYTVYATCDNGAELNQTIRPTVIVFEHDADKVFTPFLAFLPYVVILFLLILIIGGGAFLWGALPW